MNLCTILIALLCFLDTYISATDGPIYFTGDVSINCGSVGTSSALNGREWIGDVKSGFPALLQVKGSSTTATAIHKLISADPVPHKTARISISQFSYAFHVNQGQKIVRLHFNPATYRGFKGMRDLFTVEAGPFTLPSNFSASLTADALGLKSFAKEFCLNIQENEQLIVTFSPATSSSLDSTYAFINGIAIISVPTGLSYFVGGDTGVQVVGQKSLVHVDHHTALEIVHRLSIKPNPVLSTGDFDGVFPMWAMRKANKNRNDTWKVPVDVGFRYLIRLHISELGHKIAGNNDGVFKDSPSWIIQTLLSVLGRRNAVATFAVIMIAMVNVIVHKLREIWEAGSSGEKNKPSARAERISRRFSLAEIRFATRNFDDLLFIGRGGFGEVYKGLIDKGQNTVAVKRLKSNSRQGAHEFLTEIETLTELRHVNLVSLIGYCNEHGEMILIYDYMAGGCWLTTSTNVKGKAMTVLLLPGSSALTFALGLVVG
ncbi:UNVERIFIED_CONTAM: Receptor-like protein kinase ANXUR1 [Sesamum calycinum]|uniref:Receptor-like protein kinase ANXUR1 n=1 Tax=Sesamum calycinum TaxID=2727403 RepID=A0AAW2KYV7_9LAMI